MFYRLFFTPLYSLLSRHRWIIAIVSNIPKHDAAAFIGLSVDSGYVIHIVMRLSTTITFMLLLATAVMLRTRPSGKASGLESRISALVGTFLMYSIALFPRRELSLSLEMVSTSLTRIGTVGAVVALGQLGRSFSLMAETRQLVTSGPYHFVRHPLYLAEEIAIVGLYIQFVSLWTAILSLSNCDGCTTRNWF